MSSRKRDYTRRNCDLSMEFKGSTESVNQTAGSQTVPALRTGGLERLSPKFVIVLRTTSFWSIAIEHLYNAITRAKQMMDFRVAVRRCQTQDVVSDKWIYRVPLRFTMCRQNFKKQRRPVGLRVEHDA